MTGGTAASLSLYAAGSLDAALSEVARAFTMSTGTRITATFGPSGTLRARIEAGETADIFASADIHHPKVLEAASSGGPVALFARNRLSLLARPDLDISSDTALTVMRDPAIRLGISTQGADPSGDYAHALFDKTGDADALKDKAMSLTGGPDSATPPDGRNAYAWLIETGQADVYLTYHTNALLARTQMPSLQIVELPDMLQVCAGYGLIVLRDAPTEAWKLAMHILSPAGQSVLGRYGFDAAALPKGD